MRDEPTIEDVRVFIARRDGVAYLGEGVRMARALLRRLHAEAWARDEYVPHLLATGREDAASAVNAVLTKRGGGR